MFVIALLAWLEMAGKSSYWITSVGLQRKTKQNKTKQNKDVSNVSCHFLEEDNEDKINDVFYVEKNPIGNMIRRVSSQLLSASWIQVLPVSWP